MRGILLRSIDNTPNRPSRAHLQRADCRMFSHSGASPQAYASSNEWCTSYADPRHQQYSHIYQTPNITGSTTRAAYRPVLHGDQVACTHDGVQQSGHTLGSFSSKPQQSQMAQSLADMRPAEDIPVYVMLPLDTVNSDGVFRYAYIPWFSQALQVLALSGVHGVAVDVWWCAVERSPRQYNWTGYKQLFEMVRGIGLKLQVVLSFHACGGNVGDLAQVPLPSWVLEAGQQDPDIFFTDRPRETGLGQRNKEYLSIWADDCEVLPAGPSGTSGRRTPLQAYEEFMTAFRDTFHEQLGNLIEEVVVGTGPCGELRYPSYVEANGWRFPGVGEFQCYDRRALASLAAAAAAAGRPEWGYAGPHDSGGYNSSPGDTGFFAPGGSWGTEYGSFFLGWYSSCLLQHGERLLQIANRVFGSYKAPKQPWQGPLAQAQAVMRRLQSMVAGNSIAYSSQDGHSTCSSSSSTNSLVAVAAAATVAAAAAAGGASGDASSIAAAAIQAKGLLQHVQGLQQQQHSRPGFSVGRMSSSSDDETGSTLTSSPSIGGSSTATPVSCSSAGASTTSLTKPGSFSQLPPVPERQHQQVQVQASGSLAPAAAPAGPAAAAALASSVWDQLASPQAQALASSILQQLQINGNGGASSSLPLMAAGPAAGNDAGGPAAVVAALANGGASHADAVQSVSSIASTAMPTVSSASSSSAQDLYVAGLLSASEQHLASLSLSCSDDSRISNMTSSSPTAAGVAAGATVCAGLATAVAANSAENLGSATVAGSNRFGSDGSGNSNSSGTIFASNAAEAGTEEAGAVVSAGSDGSALLHTFLEALSGLGLDINGKSGQLQEPQHQRRRKWQQQQQRLVLTLKIAGVHWWYNSTSHASELTAGYYNTDSRDGYTPILRLCEKYAVNLTLTCVEMCDAQHPSYALCGPEGLLRQIRAMAARQQVSLSGENALPIFTTGGVDAVALDRVVSNVRACRASPLRSCSSWPGPATTSGAGDPYCGSSGADNTTNGYNRSPFYSVTGRAMNFAQPYGSSQCEERQHSSSHAPGLQHSYSSMGGSSRSGYMQQQSFGLYQQQPAYHHHYGAGMGGAGNVSAGRTFSELGTILTYNAEAAAAAAGNGISSSHWQQHQQQHENGSDSKLHGSSQHVAATSIEGSGSGAGSGGQSTTAGADVLLPAMRAFTFLRLGPEILQPECHASWMRFMHRMLNERA